MRERDCIPGLIVKIERRPGATFKLAVILCVSDRAPGKVRVCVWSANSNCWSNPQTCAADRLVVLNSADFAGRRGSVVRGALANLNQHKRVSYPRGAWPFAKPTTDPPVWPVEDAEVSS